MAALNKIKGNEYGLDNDLKETVVAYFKRRKE
jgi:hypothetical protein